MTALSVWKAEVIFFHFRPVMACLRCWCRNYPPVHQIPQNQRARVQGHTHNVRGAARRPCSEVKSKCAFYAARPAQWGQDKTIPRAPIHPSSRGAHIPESEKQASMLGMGKKVNFSWKCWPNSQYFGLYRWNKSILQNQNWASLVTGVKIFSFKCPALG